MVYSKLETAQYRFNKYIFVIVISTAKVAVVVRLWWTICRWNSTRHCSLFEPDMPPKWIWKKAAGAAYLLDCAVLSRFFIFLSFFFLSIFYCYINNACPSAPPVIQVIYFCPPTNRNEYFRISFKIMTLV